MKDVLHLGLALTTAALLTACDCSDEAIREKRGMPNGDIEATLIHKETFYSGAVEDRPYHTNYYFDTDKNLETAEVLLSVQGYSGYLLNDHNEGKIGKTHKVSDWHNKLTKNTYYYDYLTRE